MRILIVEDDFVSRRIMEEFLTPYGNCDVVDNGAEAIKAFELSLEEKKPYDLVCLDIMLPEMNGHEALKKIREIEKKQGIACLDGTKIVMTTALGDHENIIRAFREQCEAYIVKPIEKAKLLSTLKELELID